jgi:hypothetical protein
MPQFPWTEVEKPSEFPGKATDKSPGKASMGRSH